MDYLLTIFLSYLLLYKYAAIFILVFLSGLLLPIPSNTILLAAGAFASQGYMDTAAVFLSALVANVLGDSIGYSLTRFWGHRIITEARMKRFSAVAMIESFVRRHYGLTIFVTRFMGTPAVVVNFLSGLIRVPFRSFVFYDMLGNALDTACFIWIGYYLGVYTENYSDILSLLGWIFFVAALIFLAAVFLRNRK